MVQTGSGKTLMARTLADIADVPFVIADATSLTQAGYVGDDVDTILLRLLHAADKDPALAEQARRLEKRRNTPTVNISIICFQPKCARNKS